MGRFNKVSPTKGFKTANSQSDRSGSTDESFFVSGKNPTKTETKFKTISPSRSNLNNQQGFKITNKSQKPMKHKDGKVEKKPFDKKTWRLQKYSKKYKLEQWEEKRKKAILRGYYKEIRDDKPKIDVQKIYEQYDSDNEAEESRDRNFVRNPNLKKRSSDDEIDDDDDIKDLNEMNPTQKGQKTKNKAYNKAKVEFERLKQEKVAEKEERLKQKKEREEALQLYKKKKNEKYKKLNKKTKRGQPIMKDRIEMLLEKIQSS